MFCRGVVNAWGGRWFGFKYGGKGGDGGNERGDMGGSLKKFESLVIFFSCKNILLQEKKPVKNDYILASSNLLHNGCPWMNVFVRVLQKVAKSRDLFTTINQVSWIFCTKNNRL